MQVALLVALAKVLAELDTVEEAVLQQCLHVIERVVQAYRGLWPKQRLPVHAALNIFLSAIAPKQAVLQSVLPRFVSILLTYTLKPAEANLIAGEKCTRLSTFMWHPLSCSCKYVAHLKNTCLYTLC